MARHEQDREDLLREATALVERIELHVQAWSEPIVAGFRRDGSASWYFGADCVYQFNAQGELRRAFRNGQIIAAERGRLYRLTRERIPTATNLVRHEFTDEEARQFLAAAHSQLTKLAAVLEAGDFTTVGQHPPEADIIARLRSWLAAFPAEIPIAKSPGVARPKGR